MIKDKPEITQAELAIGSLHAGLNLVTTGTNRVGTNGVGQVYVMPYRTLHNIISYYEG